MSNAPQNKQLWLKAINIDSSDLSRRLSELGFVCGQKIRVISSPTKHNKLIEVRGSVIALDAKICVRVVVYD